MVKAIDIRYQASESIVAQGDEIRNAQKRGFYKAKGGNGSYRMTKPSEVILTFEVDGEIKCQSVKELIRDIYNIDKVRKERAMIFLDDLITGKIVLEYEDGMLRVA